MKNTIATTALVLVAALGATSSFAADSSPRARLNNTDTSSFFAKTAPSVFSRSEVKAEFAAAAKSGNLPAMGERSPVFNEMTKSSVSRDAVKAEFLQAQREGTLPAMGNRG
jgi:hypothetical protein